MDKIRDTLNDYKEEIGEYLDFIEKINSLENNRNNKDIVEEILPKGDRPIIMLKATIFLLIYNMIENIVCSTISRIYESINITKVKYNELIPNIQRSFIDEKELSNRQLDSSVIQSGIKDLLNDYFCFETYGDGEDDKLLSFKKKMGINGTIILKPLENTLVKKLNFHFLDKNEGGKMNDISGVIARCRNDLSHGTVTFHNIGKKYSVSELKSNFEEMCLFLDNFINKSEEYLNNNYFLISNS